MAHKIQGHAWKLNYMGCVVFNFDNRTEDNLAAAFRGLAKWLDEHQNTATLTVSIHHGDEGNYLEAIVDDFDEDALA